MSERDLEWAGLLRAANAGDGAAYTQLLVALAPVLRAMARRSLAPMGLSAETEDVVQGCRHTCVMQREAPPGLGAGGAVVDPCRVRHGWPSQTMRKSSAERLVGLLTKVAKAIKSSRLLPSASKNNSPVPWS